MAGFALQGGVSFKAPDILKKVM
jgi:hypothetical protein